MEEVLLPSVSLLAMLSESWCGQDLPIIFEAREIHLL
jgi:hypothetical protein